jgi:putative ATP-dependent endonuclease of OLD family
VQIEKIRIQNYRCYEDAEIELNHPLLLVTGSNDGGKSALLQAIKIFLSSRKRDNPDPTDFRLTSPDGEKRVDEMTISTTVRIGGEKAEYRKRISREDGEVSAIYEEKVKVPADDRLRYVLENFEDTDVMSAKEGKEIMKSEFGFTDEELKSTRKSERLEQLQDYASDRKQVDDWQETRPPDFPEPYYYESEEIGDPVDDVQDILENNVGDRVREIREGEKYEEIRRDLQAEGRKQLKTLEEIFAEYDFSERNTELDPDLSVDLVKGLTLDALNVLQSGNKQSIEKMGAARRRKLLLALLEWRVRGAEEASDENGGHSEVSPLFLLYDEPDTHFDYAAQRRLFTTLHRLSEKDSVQVIAATHSLNLIDRVSIDSLVHLSQTVDQNDVVTTSVERLKDWNAIHEIARNLGLRNHIVLNACLLCTEGKTEERLIPELYRLYSGRSLPSIGVEMIRGTNRGKDPAWRLCKHILRNNREAFLMLDADAKDPQSGKKIDPAAIQQFNNEEGCRLADPSENVVFLGNKEIEDLFADHTLAAAYKRYLAEHGHQIPAGDDAEQVVSNARDHADGLCGGLEKFTFQNTDGEFSKTDFCEHLIAVLRTDPDTHPIPDEIEDAFDMLEAYVDAS